LSQANGPAQVIWKPVPERFDFFSYELARRACSTPSSIAARISSSIDGNCLFAPGHQRVSHLIIYLRPNNRSISPSFNST
jgi:hypothetical protein